MMNHATWLEERRKGVGGSDVAAILGLSPWKTAFQVYQEKRGEVENWKGNETTDWGQRMEPAIRQWYSDVTGRPVRLPEKILYHKQHPFMLASLDGFTDDGRVVEIKTARSSKGWGEPGTGEIPDYYAVQCHHYMGVTGFEVCDVPVSIAGGSPELYEVPADKELLELIIEAEEKFWQRVVDGNPPDPVTYADAVQRFGRSTAQGVVVASDSAIAAVDELRVVRKQISDYEAQEEGIKGRLIAFLGDAGDTLLDQNGNALLTYKLTKGRQSFDAKAFSKEYPELHARFLRNGEPSRRFLLK